MGKRDLIVHDSNKSFKMTKKNHKHAPLQISGFDVISNSGVEPGEGRSKLPRNFKRVLGKAIIKKKEQILNLWVKSNENLIQENPNEDQENLSTKAESRPQF